MKKSVRLFLEDDNDYSLISCDNNIWDVVTLDDLLGRGPGDIARSVSEEHERVLKDSLKVVS
jgi:hypothetical protein